MSHSQSHKSIAGPSAHGAGHHSGLAILLGALTAMGPLSIDMYLPSFPQIARDLAAPEWVAGFTLVTYLFGIALSQVLYGPVSDRLGRKGPLLAGCGVFVVGAIGCAASRSVGMLMLFRLVQALGSGAGTVLCRAIVRDRCDTREAARMFAMLMAVMGVGPVVAPWIGGQILLLGSWRLIFLVLAGFGLCCMLISAAVLRETLPRERRHRGSLAHTARQYREILRHRPFLGLALVAGFTSGTQFAYIAGAPFLFITLHRVSAQSFGIFFGANAVGLTVAAQANRLLLHRWSPRQLLGAALALNAGAAVVFLVSTATGLGALAAIVVALFLCLFGIGLANPNLLALALEPFAGQAGSASALIGVVQYGFGGMAGAAVGLLHNGTALPMSGTVCFCGVAALGAVRVLSPDRAAPAAPAPAAPQPAVERASPLVAATE